MTSVDVQHGITRRNAAYEGWSVPLEYDPLIAKLVVWGATRAEAIDRLRVALDEYHIGGIKTTVPFFREIVRDPDFCQGNIDTGFIDRWLARQTASGEPPAEPSEEEAVAVLAAGLNFAKQPISDEERAGYEAKIKRTVLRMPFDGNILTLHLKDKVNSYLDKGAPFAVLEYTGVVTAEIDVPESDVQYVKIGGRKKRR